jgi:hypothetical protein
MRLFFDYTAAECESLRDYQGNEFLSIREAIEFAEATAELLTQSLASDWSGWSIEVHNAWGDKLYSLAVTDRRADCSISSEGASPHQARSFVH